MKRINNALAKRPISPPRSVEPLIFIAHHAAILQSCCYPALREDMLNKPGPHETLVEIHTEIWTKRKKKYRTCLLMVTLTSLSR